MKIVENEAGILAYDVLFSMHHVTLNGYFYAI